MFDTTNPQVMKNYLISQMKEGKGNFEFRHNVLVFRDNGGNEYVAPKEVEEFLDAKDMPKKLETTETSEPMNPKADVVLVEAGEKSVVAPEKSIVDIAIEPEPVAELPKKRGQKKSN